MAVRDLLRRGPVRGVGRAARRVLVPEWTAVLSDLDVLRRERDRLSSDAEDLRRTVADLTRSVDELRGRLDGLQEQVHELDGGVDESRRLTARVAAVTDLVTEVVLPLHDREIDVRRFRAEGAEPS